MTAASHAAAEHKRKLNQEEESMTNYRREELEQGWEFKIVRSAVGAFRDSQTMGRTVEEERLGGWELLEKFDDERLRFRRPVAARNRDGALPRGYDPYRTLIGISEGALALYIILAIVVVLGLLI